MPSKYKKTITYGRKHRNEQIPNPPLLTPKDSISDLDQMISRSELNRRVLRQYMRFSKHPGPRHDAKTPHNMGTYEITHKFMSLDVTTGDREETQNVNSNSGLALPGQRFSPASHSSHSKQKPRSKNMKPKTTSQQLKENVNVAPTPTMVMVANRKSKSKKITHTFKSTVQMELETSSILASPFMSRPYSSRTVDTEGNKSTPETSPNVQIPYDRGDMLIALPDVDHPPSIQSSTYTVETRQPEVSGNEINVVTTSTISSQNHVDAKVLDVSFTRQRRPSVPTARPSQALFGFPSSVPPRCSEAIPDIEQPFATPGDGAGIASYPYLTPNLGSSDSRTYFTSSLEGAVDFNRPPSEMSMYELDFEDNVSDMFTHVRGRSTPNRACKLGVHPNPSTVIGGVGLGIDVVMKEKSVQEINEKEYSSWITDSIISPPSYHRLQKKKEKRNDGPVVKMLRDMEPAPSDQSSMFSEDLTANQEGMRLLGNLEQTIGQEGSSVIPPLEAGSGLTLAAPANISTGRSHSNSSGDGCSKGSLGIGVVSDSLWAGRTGRRSRSGNILGDSLMNIEERSTRNRSGTIVQGGGGARRTRSGTVVQMALPKVSLKEQPAVTQPVYLTEDANGACSCCSSDDEILLRSHSHRKLDIEDLEWKVADPPSPLGRRNRGKKRVAFRVQKGNRVRYLASAKYEEDGVEGDIDDDELDLLGLVTLD